MFNSLRQMLNDLRAIVTPEPFTAPETIPSEPVQIPSPTKSQIHPLMLPLVSRGGTSVNLQQNKYGAALAFNLTVPVNSAVRARVKTVSRAHWMIKDKNENILYSSKEGGKGNLFTTAVEAFENEYDVNLFGAWELSRAVAGETFIHLVANDWGVINGVEWLNPLDVQVFAPMGIRQRYDYNPHGENVQIPVDRMVFDRELNLLDENAGQSPVEVAIRKAQTIINGDLTMLSHLKNNARAGMTISPARATQNNPQQAQFTEVQMDQIQDAVLKTMLGSRNHNSTVVLPYPIDVNTYEIANIQPVLDLMDRVDKSIYEALHVPPAIAGNPDTSRFQRSEQDVIVFDNMIVNELEDIAHYVNRKILRVFDPNGDSRFEFDISPFIHISEEDLRISDASILHYGQGIIDKRAVIVMNSTLYRNTGVDVERLLKLAEAEENQPDPEPPIDDPEQETPDDEMDNEQEPQSDTQKAVKAEGADEAFGYVPFYNQKTIGSIQQKLKTIFTDSRIEWQTPQTYHVTLFYAQQMTDGAIHQISHRVEMEPIYIMFDEKPLAIFNTPDGQALHLAVTRNPTLDKIQADIYDVVNGLAEGVSPFSKPSDWHPHLTLAYIPDDIAIDLDALNQRFARDLSATAIESQSVIIGRDNYQPALILTATKYIRHASPKPKTTNLQLIGFDDDYYDTLIASFETWSVDNALSELKAFQKYIGNRKSADNFKPYFLTGDIFDAVIEAKDPRAEIDRQINVLIDSQKSLGGLETEFRRGIQQILDDPKNRESFITRMDQLITRFGERAYKQGLEDSGVRDDPNDDDRTNIGTTQNEQREYIRNLADKIFSDNPPSDAQMERKPDQWVNKTLREFYHEGMLSGRRNPMIEWVYNPEKDHCKDCIRLNGQRHRANDWKRSGWKPQDSKLACHGDECGCDFIRVVGRQRGNF